MFTAFTQGPRLWITFLLLLVVRVFSSIRFLFLYKTVARGENCYLVIFYLPCGHLQASESKFGYRFVLWEE